MVYAGIMFGFSLDVYRNYYIFCKSRWSDYGAETIFLLAQSDSTVDFLFEYGTAGVFTTTWVLPNSYPVVADQKMSIVGEKSCVNIDLCEQMVKMATEEKFMNPRILGTPVNGHLNAPPAHMLNGYIETLERGEKPLATEDDGLKNTVIIAAIHESIETGLPVDIC